MRRLLHLVARLYPDTWRQRYGPEFTALLEDIRPQWTDVFPLEWRPVERRTSGAIVHVRADDAAISDYVRELAQRALSTSFLAEVIRDYNLYPKERSRRSSADVIPQMRKDIKFRVEENAFRVEFSYSDPAIAQHVANEVVSRFVEANMTLAVETVNRGTRPLGVTIFVNSSADLPRVPAAPNRLAWASFDLAGGALVGAAAVWLAGRRWAITA